MERVIVWVCLGGRRMQGLFLDAILVFVVIVFFAKSIYVQNVRSLLLVWKLIQ